MEARELSLGVPRYTLPSLVLNELNSAQVVDRTHHLTKHNYSRPNTGSTESDLFQNEPNQRPILHLGKLLRRFVSKEREPGFQKDRLSKDSSPETHVPSQVQHPARFGTWY